MWVNFLRSISLLHKLLFWMWCLKHNLALCTFSLIFSGFGNAAKNSVSAVATSLDSKWMLCLKRCVSMHARLEGHLEIGGSEMIQLESRRGEGSLWFLWQLWVYTLMTVTADCSDPAGKWCTQAQLPTVAENSNQHCMEQLTAFHFTCAIYIVSLNFPAGHNH
jgi:hypothetical protein